MGYTLVERLFAFVGGHFERRCMDGERPENGFRV